METVSCNLCGKRDYELVKVVPEHRYGIRLSFNLVRCTRCGLVFLNPRPDEQELLAYYPPEYQAAMRQVLQEVRQSYIGRIGLRIMRHARKPPLERVGIALDIGCSGGDYLAFLRKLGWEVCGIELDEGAARHARERYGIHVHAGPAEHTLGEFPDNGFDVVTMWHVLEHVFDPLLVLREVSRILKSDGILLLEMPNYNSLWASILGEFWFPLEIPRHLYHFTPSTLQAILTKAGFRVAKLSGVPAPIEIIWSFHLLWDRWRRTSSDGRLSWAPAGVVLLYPLELLLAQFLRSTFMKAMAVQSPSVNS